MGKDTREIRDQIEQTRERMGDTVEALGYKADVPSRVKENVHDRVEAVKGTIGDVVDNVKSAVGGSVPDLGDLRGGARRAAGIAGENPIGLALGALAAGFLAGLLVPVTDAERERIGPLREQLVDQAQSAAGELVAHGKAVVHETAQAAMQSAQSHGQRVVDAATSRPEPGFD